MLSLRHSYRTVFVFTLNACKRSKNGLSFVRNFTFKKVGVALKLCVCAPLGHVEWPKERVTTPNYNNNNYTAKRSCAKLLVYCSASRVAHVVSNFNFVNFSCKWEMVLTRLHKSLRKQRKWFKTIRKMCCAQKHLME